MVNIMILGIKFIPDEIFSNKPKKITGIISFSYKDKEDVDMKIYTSIADRDAIIEEWRNYIIFI